MNFEQLKRRVERAEFLMEERTRKTHAALEAVRLHWREAWTPGRIVGVGLVAGFIAGRTQPGPAVKRLRAAAGPQMLQWVSTFSGLSASIQAAMAAMTAKGAARTADAAADTAEQAADTVEGAAATATATTLARTPAPVAAVRVVAPHGHAPGTPVIPSPTVAAAPEATALPGTEARGTLPPSERRYQPDPPYRVAPRPAEAATDVSEDPRPRHTRGDRP